MSQVGGQDVGSATTEQPLPAIAAAFLVTFDNRKGYTLAWQQALDGVHLDGAVEYQCLPSGLHNVDDDLVYFMHEGHAGISAFQRKGDAQAERNARMLSVGVLVPLDAGRMGKSFLYAEQLKDLARTLIDDQAVVTLLEGFWDKHKKSESNSVEAAQSPQPLDGYQKLRALSTTTLASPGPHHTLPPHHPALAFPGLIRSFGPLLFPLFRATLLRQRILILGDAPVEETCNFVYCLSILSSISGPIEPQITGLKPARSYLRPLFNIGIADIPKLEQIPDPWIACTTDDVIASKPQLFDLLVVMPNLNTAQKYGNTDHAKLVNSSPDLLTKFPKHGLRATQRDARRITSLRVTLAAMPSGAQSEAFGRDSDDTGSDTASTTSSQASIPDKRDMVEPTPWSVMAYTSLVWWASAGDRRSGLMEAEELSNEQDEALLHECTSEEGTTKEVALVAYFHKLTGLIFSVLAAAIRRKGTADHERYRDDDDQAVGDDDDSPLLAQKDDEDNEEPIEITEEDVRAMGLDVWSQADLKFIEDMLHVWWRKKAIIRAGVIECCGIRIL